MDKIALLFEKYKEPDSDIMDANGKIMQIYVTVLKYLK